MVCMWWGRGAGVWAWSGLSEGRLGGRCTGSEAVTRHSCAWPVVQKGAATLVTTGAPP